MANTAGSFQPQSGGTGLPTPIWVKDAGTVNVAIYTGQTVTCDIMKVKVPLVDQSLIDDLKLYVQFGRVSESDSRTRPTPSKRRRRIKWYTPHIGGTGVYNGSGEVGGSHTGNTAVDRLNLIPVVQQNETVGDLPYWAFYGLTTSYVLVGDPNNGFVVPAESFYMTGNRKTTSVNPTLFLPGSGLYKKRPQRPMTRSRTHSVGYWFCRLVVVEDGKVVAYGPHGEACVTTPAEVRWNQHYQNSNLASGINDGEFVAFPNEEVIKRISATIEDRHRR